MSELIPYTPPFHLSPDDYVTIENLAAVNYSPSNIALYLGVNRRAFLQEYHNPESTVRYHYDKGLLTTKFEMDNALLENAKKGNVTAIQIIDKHHTENEIENHKSRILYGD